MCQDMLEPQGSRQTFEVFGFGVRNDQEEEPEPTQHQEPAADDNDNEDAEFKDAEDVDQLDIVEGDALDEENGVGDAEDDDNSDEEPDAEKRSLETWSALNQQLSFQFISILI